MQEFIFKVFRAVDDPKSSEEFVDGHTKVLIDYGVPMITSNKPSWMLNPNVYCVTVRLASTSEMVGGIRIHISRKDSLLPMEDALGKMDDKIYEMINSYKEHGVGELCGLWNAKSCANVGLGLALTRAGIAVVQQLSFQTLMGICAAFTMKMFRKVGFRVTKDYDIIGSYPYPTKDYITNVLGMMNAATLNKTEEEDKAKILSLRENPIQETTEKGKKINFKANYQLLL